MCIRNWFACLNQTYDNAAYIFSNLDQFLNFKTAGEKLFFKLLCGNVNIDEFF